MASKLGEVLEIKAADSYIKRPAGPMVTIELKDISKLQGFIRIPSMVKGTENTITIAQKILYLGLLNQCRRCRRFGHHARACITNRSKPWEGMPTSNLANSKGVHGKDSDGARAPQSNKTQTDKQLRSQNERRNQGSAGSNQKLSEVDKQARHPAQPDTRASSGVPPNAGEPLTNPKVPPQGLEIDQEMADSASPSGPEQVKPDDALPSHGGETHLRG